MTAEQFLARQPSVVTRALSGVSRQDREDARQILLIETDAILSSFDHIGLEETGRKIIARTRTAVQPLKRARRAARMTVQADQGLLRSRDTPESLCGASIALHDAGATERETAVAAGLMDGLSYGDVADELGVSVPTVGRCVMRLKSKLIASGIVEKTARIELDCVATVVG